MDCMFSLSHTYRAEEEKYYTYANLEETFRREKWNEADPPTESLLKRAKVHYWELYNAYYEVPPEKRTRFPRLKDLEGEERFQLLQVMYYLIRKGSEKKISCPGFWDKLEKPSYQYQKDYFEMLDELKPILQEPILLPEPSAGYPKSVHACFQLVELITHTFVYKYNSPLGLYVLKENLQAYETELHQIARRRSRPACGKNGWWAPILHRLWFCAYCGWEFDEFQAFRLVRNWYQRDRTQAEAAVEKPAKKLSEIDYRAMRDPKKRRVIEEDRCSLVLRGGGIVEDFFRDGDRYELDGTELQTDDYFAKLHQYIGEHAEELARKVFCLEDGTACGTVYKAAVLKNRNKIESALHFEINRYSRASCVTKSKLIAMYQVYFLSTVAAGFTEKTGIAKCPIREKKSLSSSYWIPEEKDPFFHHVLCVMADYQTIFNESEDYWGYADAYLEYSFRTLSVFLGCDAEEETAAGKFPWTSLNKSCCGETGQQLAEEILWTAVKTLISEEDGMAALGEFLWPLAEEGVIGTGPGKLSFLKDPSLVLFGKWCVLLGISLTDVREKFKAAAEGPQGAAQVREVPVDSDADGILLRHPLKFSICGQIVKFET